jgi:hypothetical protein
LESLKAFSDIFKFRLIWKIVNVKKLFNLLLSLGRHITCQIDSKEDASTTNTSTDINSDGVYTNGDYQSLMRPHPLHVKVTLILSRNY